MAIGYRPFRRYRTAGPGQYSWRSTGCQRTALGCVTSDQRRAKGSATDIYPYLLGKIVAGLEGKMGHPFQSLYISRTCDFCAGLFGSAECDFAEREWRIQDLIAEFPEAGKAIFSLSPIWKKLTELDQHRVFNRLLETTDGDLLEDAWVAQ